MRRGIVLLSLILCLVGSAQGSTQSFPKPVGAVNDFAGVVPEQYAAQIGEVARALWDQTETALVVATFQDLSGESPEEFTTNLYESWGIGQKGQDKGLLIVVALQERRIRVETGYGIEGILPDGRVGEIMDRYMVPFLRKGEIGKALLSGSAAFAQVVAQEAGVQLDLRGEREQPTGTTEGTKRGRLLPLLLLLFIIISFFGRGMGWFPFFFLPWMFMGGGGGRGFGSGVGGFGGGFGGFGGGLSGGGGATRGF
jgi:uncharacterized protein